MSYIALLHAPESGSDYGITFPDLPGCVSAGTSRKAAIEQGAEALAGHLAALQADGERPPAARSVSELLADPEVREHAGHGDMVVIVPRIRSPRQR